MQIDGRFSGSPTFLEEVSGLDDAAVLALAEESELDARRVDRRKLRLAVHFAERRVVTDVLDAARWTDADRRDIDESIGADGTPLIAAGCVEQLAVAIGVSARTAMQLVSDGLDLAYRLPKVNARVERLEVAPWRARRIAVATHSLSQEAAAWVDAKLAPVADECGPVRIDRLVTEAAARFDPVEQAEAEDEARAAWDVRLDHYTGPVWGGTSRLEVIGDTATLTKVHDLVAAKAHELLDPDVPAVLQPLGERKVAALGLIADGAAPPAGPPPTST